MHLQVWAWRTLVALSLVLVMSCRVAAEPQTPSARLDRYFRDPTAPEVYRALSGLGDPDLPRWYPDPYGEDWEKREAEANRLFPAGEHDWSSRCRTDYAVQLLRDREARLGAGHPYIGRWIAAQQAVFANCSTRSRSTATPLPPPLPVHDPSVAALQVEDRAWQQASILFYRGELRPALAAFAKIAASRSSHWMMARWMVAAIRAGSTPENWYRDATKPLVPPAQSLAEAEAILADPELKPIHPLAQQLIGWIGYWTADPASRRAQVHEVLKSLDQPVQALTADTEASRLYQEARDDLSYLHRYAPEDTPTWWLGAGPPPAFTASRAMMEAAKTDPLAAWTLAPRSYLHDAAWAPFDTGEPAGWPELRAYADRRAELGAVDSFAWSRLAHTISRRYDASLWADIEAETKGAEAGDQRAIAALALDAYHQVRNALSSWDTLPSRWSENSAPAFDAALSYLQRFPLKDSRVWSAMRHDGLQYLMSVNRLAEARRWRDALYIQAFSTWGDPDLLSLLAEDEDHFVSAMSMGEPPLPLQNDLSIAALRRLAGRSDTPAPLRAKFARIAWSRTYALGRTVDPDLDHLVRQLNPTLTKTWTSRPGAIRPTDRRALLDVLRSPAINILIVDADRDVEGDSDDQPGLLKLDLYNHDDDNWWCRWKVGRNRRASEQTLFAAFFASANLNLADGATAYGLRSRLDPLLASSFAYRSRDLAETEALAGIPCAPKVLTERAIGWVEHPGLFGSRKGQDEALALAVRTTRYGCYSDGPHGAYSKRAWTLLHERFPNSPWAAKTKYWFNCPVGGTECPAMLDD